MFSNMFLKSNTSICMSFFHQKHFRQNFNLVQLVDGDVSVEMLVDGKFCSKCTSQNLYGMEKDSNI